MKLSFSLKNKEASVEADVEKLIDKSLDYNHTKKTRYQIKQEEKRKTKELERKQMIQGILIMLGILVVILIICAIGAAFE